MLAGVDGNSSGGISDMGGDRGKVRGVDGPESGNDDGVIVMGTVA